MDGFKADPVSTAAHVAPRLRRIFTFVASNQPFSESFNSECVPLASGDDFSACKRGFFGGFWSRGRILGRYYKEACSHEVIDGFLRMARTQNLLESSTQQVEETEEQKVVCNPSRTDGARQPENKRPSILYWRKNLFDPDRLFNWMEPKLSFFWTRAFLTVSTGCIALATVILWANSQQIVALPQNSWVKSVTNSGLLTTDSSSLLPCEVAWPLTQG